MTENNSGIALLEGLNEQRLRWLEAYRIKDVATLSFIETKEFFVIHYQNVEKKAEWHNNIMASNEVDDPLLQLERALKTRYDTLDSNTHVITSYFRHSDHSTVVKEMWVNRLGEWHISSLALTRTQIR